MLCNKKLLAVISAHIDILMAIIIQQQNTRNSIAKRQKRALWARKWLLRRDAGRGASNFVFTELKVEDPCSFRNFTRMSVVTFELLLGKVAKRIVRRNTSFRECIAPHTRLLVALRFLATGETYQSLSYSFRISVPALSQIIPEVIIAVYEALKGEYLKTPRSSFEWKNIALRFWKLWNFPMCLGALDGKHIAFRAKKEDGSFYYNYKGFHSIVLLALVDADYYFKYVDVGCNGRVSDGGVYSNSLLSKAIEQNLLNFPTNDSLPGTDVIVPYAIVADDAFKASKIILKPWGQRSDLQKRIFNYRLSRARRVVENAFGILSNRFQILQKDINLSVENVQNITLTCCALHNFIRTREGKHYLAGVDTENTENVTLTKGDWRNKVFLTNLEQTRANRSSTETINIRMEWTNYFNGVGAVSWQKEAVKRFNF